MGGHHQHHEPRPTDRSQSHAHHGTADRHVDHDTAAHDRRARRRVEMFRQATAGGRWRLLGGPVLLRGLEVKVDPLLQAAIDRAAARGLAAINAQLLRRARV